MWAGAAAGEDKHVNVKTAARVPGAVALRSSAFPLGTVTSAVGGAHCKQGTEQKCTLELFLARDKAAADTAVGSKC